MKDLGELGVARKFKPLYFGWFGHRLRVRPGATELALLDFMEQASAIELPEGLDLNDTVGSFKAMSPGDREKAEQTLKSSLPMTKDFLRRCVHPEDFDEFWRLAGENGQTTQDLLGVGSTLLDKAAEQSVGRPTVPSQGSGPMRRKTRGKSGGGSSLRAIDSGPAKVIRRLEKSGRPDIAEIHLVRQESLAGSR